MFLILTQPFHMTEKQIGVSINLVISSTSKGGPSADQNGCE